MKGLIFMYLGRDVGFSCIEHKRRGTECSDVDK